MKDSILQEEKECFITGITGDLHKHHIFFGSNRKNSDDWGCWVWLAPDWHNMSDYGVHFNKKLDLHLKKLCQRRFEELYGHDKFMEVFGKNYL